MHHRSLVKVEFFCTRHKSLERTRIPILQTKQSDCLESIVARKGSDGAYLKALRAGSQKTKSEIEQFLLQQLVKFGASQSHPIKIDISGW